MSSTTSPRLRGILFTLAIYTAFFASGASSLIAEVTWNRMLIVVVGNSLDATAMILVVFMGGLGLGSFVGGRFFARRKPSLVPYVLLEIVIGAYVLLSPATFDLLSRFFTGLARQVDNPAALTLVRIVVSMAALLLPAFLMGATFPAVVSGAAARTASGRTARIGYLYSINTLGAAVGCFAAGYHLLFEFGVQTTLTVAFVLYLAASALALIASLLSDRKREVVEVEEVEPEVSAVPRLRRFLYGATFGVGFLSLAYEVLLTRLSILYLGNSVSVFPLVLTGFLLGVGISAVAGTWLYGLLRRHTGSSGSLFGVTAILAGAAILLAPYLLLTDWVLGPEMFARFADATRRNPLPILGIIIGPTVLVGALLPVAIRMLRPEGRGEATRGAATLYALNTAGGLLGAAVANHYLVPWIGVQAVTLILAFLAAGIGLISLLIQEKNVIRWSAAGAAVAVLGVMLTASLPDTTDLYARKLAESTQAREAEVLFVREGRAATVCVVDQRDPQRGSYRDMYLNGVEEASTRYWHTQLFKLLGILPVLVHESEEPKEALVIAFGAGITAGSVLASDEVGSLDVVDLNPDIEDINDLFTEVNGNVFHSPRFTFHNDDGRSYLVTSGKRYDLIIGDSTHPRAYDSWILYTEEFYEAVKERLRPGGIFAQWVPVHGSMQGDLFKIHLRTFRRSFPNSTFWYVYGSDQAFLMATPETLELNATRLQDKLDRLPEWFQAGTYQIDTVERVAGFFWMDGPAMNRLIGEEARVNTDDVHYFDKQSAIRPARPADRLPMFQASAVPLITPMSDSLRTGIGEQQQVAYHLALYGFFGDQDQLHRAYCLEPANGNARYWMSLAYAGAIPDPEAFCDGLESDEIRRYRAMVAAHPDNPVTLNGLASLLAEAGKLQEALPLAEKAVILDPENGMILDTLGWILHLQGKTGAALEVLGQSLRFLPGHPIVLYHLGAAHLAQGETREAIDYLEGALKASGDFPGADDARKLLQEAKS